MSEVLVEMVDRNRAEWSHITEPSSHCGESQIGESVPGTQGGYTGGVSDRVQDGDDGTHVTDEWPQVQLDDDLPQDVADSPHRKSKPRRRLRGGGGGVGRGACSHLNVDGLLLRLKQKETG